MNARPRSEQTTHEAAADWLQRLDNPDLAEEELQAWLEWFGGSDENRKAFEELQLLRRNFRAAPAELRAQARERLGLTSSAQVVAGENGRFSNKRSMHGWALAASICAIAFMAAFWWSTHQSSTDQTYSAPANQHRTVKLNDGSALVLAADAVVAVRYTPQRRELNVERGAAYFEVEHNPSRPFVVEVADVQVTAIGTAFNVRRERAQVIVTVTEGVVEISGNAGKSKSRLSVGKRAVLPLATIDPSSSANSDGASIQWQQGRADFVDAPLEEVLAFVNQYASMRVVIDDPRVADLTYSGTVLRAHLDEWMTSLPRVYNIRVVPLEDGTLTLVSRHDR